VRRIGVRGDRRWHLGREQLNAKGDPAPAPTNRKSFFDPVRGGPEKEKKGTLREKRGMGGEGGKNSKHDAH